MSAADPPQKILVIEDEESYRQVIAGALSMAGYEIIEATNGLDGLGAAKLHHPDLILCDINMPKMDGLDLLETLKKDNEFAGIPFIFLTGNAAPGDVRKGMRLGADDYITKPFSADDLITAVETRLKKKVSLQRYYESQFDDIKSSITHSLPHEFRTPLNGILGFSQMLIDDSTLPTENVKEIAEMINRSGKRLHRLLENMVLFGQLQLWIRNHEKCRELQEERTFRLAPLCSPVAEELMRKYGRTGAIHLSIEEIPARIGPKFFSKIAEELMDNGLKFSDPGTTVHVTTTREEGMLVLTVADAGRGMTPEQIGKISALQQFDRNYYEQQGAGLGLTIARLLAEIHGGKVEITSRSGATSVRVLLPADDESK